MNRVFLCFKLIEQSPFIPVNSHSYCDIFFNEYMLGYKI